MPALHIPKSFKKKIIGAFGNEGSSWLDTLEERVRKYADSWHLEVKVPVDNLSYNYVLKAVDEEGNPVILKLGLPGFDFANEIKTVQAYGGNRCAKVLKSDAEGGSMLLEQLLPGTMLTQEGEEEAIQHFAEVWQAIRCPVPHWLDSPVMMDWAKGIDRYLTNHPKGKGPVSMYYTDKAMEYFREITETSTGMELLHGDLHHQNILYSEIKGWTAIDPKGVAGDSSFGLISFMTNEIHNKPNPKKRFETRANALVQTLKLDRNRFLKAGVAMSILYACWGVEDHDPEWINFYICGQWFQQLLED